MAAIHRPPALVLALLLAAAAAAACVCRADVDADRKECTDQLVQLEPCLPYAAKRAPNPTPSCCESLRAMLGKSLRCLCILIKDKDDPAIKQYNIDLDRALTIPAACAINASMAECPKLLNLAPDSPEAQLFRDVEGKLRGNSTGGSSNPATASPSTPTTTGSTSGALRRHYYGHGGMGSLLGWVGGGGLWVSSSVAASLLHAVLNVLGA